MSSKIFKSTFWASIITLFISFLLIFGMLFEYFEAQVFTELESEAGYISYAVNNYGRAYIDNFKGANTRITLIAPDGTVLADTSADTGNLENHADREEVQSALKDGSGKSTRYSDTLMQKTLYYAQKLDNGSVLRVSATQNSVIVILLGLVQPLILIIAIVLAISFYLSRKAAKSIVKPLNELNLESPESNETYDELTPMLKKLSAQHKTIERQLSEAEQSRREFKLICENMNEGLLVIDKSAKVLSYNSAALRLLEITDINNSSVLNFNRTKGFRDVIEKALGGNRAQSDISLDENTYNLIASPVYRNNEIIGAVIVIIDITESAKREQLRREFTSNVSHELKTPIALIEGYAEGLVEGLAEDKDSRDYYCNVIMDEAVKMNRMVRELTSLISYEFGNNTPDLTDFNICDLIRSVTESLSIKLEEKGAKLKTELPESLMVRADEFKIEEVYTNYLNNAMNHLDGERHITVRAEEDDKKITVYVYNDGMPIPLESIPHLWEKFYKVDKARTRAYGGSGIGLSIVKAIMDAHGGGYGVSNKEHGVEFYFYLNKVLDDKKNV